MGFVQSVTNIDFSILNFIYENLRCGFLNVLMPIFSFLGEYGLVWIVITVLCLIFRKTRACGVAIFVSVLAAFLIGECVIKDLVCRVRPCNYAQYSYIDMLVSRPDSYSFPSGHTSSSFAAATAMMFYNKKLGIPALVLASLIGFSRLYNFVHFPTDVMCGMLLGIICAVIVCCVFRKVDVNGKINSLRLPKRV